jgi:hypothetical protein
MLGACSSAEPKGVTIEIVGAAPGEVAEFTATGPAVDDGVVCASGTTRLRAALGDEAAEAAIAAGRELSLESGLDVARRHG